MTPTTAEPVLPAVNVSKYIDSQFFGERPHIRGRRITVYQVAVVAQAENLSVSRLMYEFSLSESEVLAALLYYAEYRTALDAQEATLTVQYGQPDESQ